MGPALEKPNSTLQHQVSHHSPISSVVFLPLRRESLHGSINDVGIAQGPGWDDRSTTAIAARARVVFRPIINQLRAPERDVVLCTKPADGPPCSGARVPTDAPHDADVVGAYLDRAGAPVGQPARERVEQREGGDVLVGQVV